MVLAIRSESADMKTGRIGLMADSKGHYDAQDWDRQANRRGYLGTRNVWSRDSWKTSVNVASWPHAVMAAPVGLPS
jgi:hypothetical protein